MVVFICIISSIIFTNNLSRSARKWMFSIERDENYTQLQCEWTKIFDFLKCFANIRIDTTLRIHRLQTNSCQHQKLRIYLKWSGFNFFSGKNVILFLLFKLFKLCCYFISGYITIFFVLNLTIRIDCKISVYTGIIQGFCVRFSKAAYWM